ncbi:unnamed protein product [Aphanomyces euteiches]
MREQVNAYQAFMKFDSLATLKKTNADEVARRELEKQIDLWVSEHGEYDEKGIQPKFDAKKIRIYSSYWNWVMQDALYYRTLATVEGVKIGVSIIDHDSYLAQMAAFLNTDLTDLVWREDPDTWHRPFLCKRWTPELPATTEFLVARQQALGKSDLPFNC